MRITPRMGATSRAQKPMEQWANTRTELQPQGFGGMVPRKQTEPNDRFRACCMNYIAFSIYGGAPKYAAGICKNAILAKHWYAGWKVVVYAAKDVPADVISYL